MQLWYGLLAELVAAPGEGDALAAFLASAHIGATVGGNATGFSPLSPVAVPLWADPRGKPGHVGGVECVSADGEVFKGGLGVKNNP
jgi:hypothetical protein